MLGQSTPRHLPRGPQRLPRGPPEAPHRLPRGSPEAPQRHLHSTARPRGLRPCTACPRGLRPCPPAARAPPIHPGHPRVLLELPPQHGPPPPTSPHPPQGLSFRWNSADWAGWLDDTHNMHTYRSYVLSRLGAPRRLHLGACSTSRVLSRLSAILCRLRVLSRHTACPGGRLRHPGLRTQPWC